MEETKDLTGSAKAAATLRNKLRFGAEGTALFGGLTIAGKKLVLPVGKKILQTSKIVLNTGDKIQALASANSDVEIFVSYLEIT